jgi:hypothetical protein
MVSRVASLALAMLLAIAMAPKSAQAQELTAAAGDPASQSEGAAKQQPDSSDQTPDAKTPASQTSEPASKTTGSEPPVAAGVDGQDQKANAGGQARQKKNANKPVRTALVKRRIQNIAEETLENLDSALDSAQKSERLADAAPDKRLEDCSARRDQLRQRASVAKDDAAWIDVATGADAVLADTLKLMKANLSSAANARQAGGGQSTMNPAVPPPSQSRDSLRLSPNLSLYVAGLSLVVSMAALGGGWLLVRREINRVLTEAGLL